MWGSPYVELADSSAIQSSSGYTAAVRRVPSAYVVVLLALNPWCRSNIKARVTSLGNHIPSKLSSPEDLTPFRAMKGNGQAFQLQEEVKDRCSLILAHQRRR